MSEKVTFGELIESIAEETEHSKQFTHDFLKDFVDVINGGLEEDGKVNIAGFGKFELQRVDEREGHNPQTEEKITIPAHNKVVFKPYKDLRELVNAPYAHMEPQLIEEEETEASDEDRSSPSQQEQEIESQTGESGVAGDKSSNEENEQLKQEKKTDPDIPKRSEEQELNEDDFIPTAPPTSHEQNKDDLDGEDQTGTEQESPFDMVEQQDVDENLSQDTTSELSDNEDDDDNGDIVEFNAAQSDTEDDLLEEFIRSEEKEDDVEPSEDLTDTEEEQLESEKNESHETEEELAEPVSSEQNDEDKPTGKSEEEVLAEEVEKLEETAENLKHDQKGQSDQENEETPRPAAATSRPSDRNSSFLYVAAAAIILLLIAGGAWYYSTFPTNDTDTTLISSSEEQTVSADATMQQNNNNEQQPAEEQAEDTQQATQNQSQSVTQSTATTQSTSNTTPNNQAVEIEEGQTLWSLAEDRYGNPRLWPWIYGNNDSLDDPDLIYAGSSLSVPLPSGPQNTLTDTDSVGVAKGYIATYKWYKSNEEPKAKNHLWAAKLFHDDLQQLADVPIDQTDLSYANRAR
jgi:DNA-binding protein HU-beta